MSENILIHELIKVFFFSFFFFFFIFRKCRQACATSAAVRDILLVSVKMAEVLEAVVVVVASNYSFLKLFFVFRMSNLLYSYALCPEAFGYVTISTSNG